MSANPTFAALAELDASLARGLGIAVSREPSAKVTESLFKALVADLAEVREGSASLYHDRMADQ